MPCVGKCQRRGRGPCEENPRPPLAAHTPIASRLLDRASTLMRRPTGSSRGQRPVTPIGGGELRGCVELKCEEARGEEKARTNLFYFLSLSYSSYSTIHPRVRPGNGSLS